MSMSQVLQNAILNGFVDFQGLAVAKVLSYDADNYTCDVEPLKFHPFLAQSGPENKNYAKINKVPIVFTGGKASFIKADFAKGDLVALGLAASAFKVDGTKTSDIAGLMSKGNAVILGGIGPRSGIPSIMIKETEIVFTVGTTTFTINAAGATVSVGGLTVNLFTHIHPTGVGPSGPPTPGT